MKKRPAGSSADRKTDGSGTDFLVKAVDCLRRGGIVAVPTETYYGLAVDPYNDKALQALFKLKKREQHKPILVLISDIRQLDSLGATIPLPYHSLIKRFWPGPLTLIFPVGEVHSPLLTGGSGTLGIRISSNELVTRLCVMFGRPITATSANISGRAPARSAVEVEMIFGRRIDHIVDGGTSPGGACSTVVGIRDGYPVLLRKGQISFPSILQTFEKGYHMDTLKWDKRFALEQTADDAELLHELLDIFKGSFTSDLALIKEGIQKGDTKQVYRAAHSIKGAAASLGIEGIKDIVSTIEADSKNGSLQVATEELRNLEEMFLKLKNLG